jgi:GT2 family glycosyltransferase
MKHTSKTGSVLLLVVLYRQTLSDAGTIQSLKAAAAALTPSDTILIWDNSPQPQPATDVEQFRKLLKAAVRYDHHPENTPLSRVYNQAIALDDDAELIVFLDQDSHFDAQYLDALRQAAIHCPDVLLFAPLIRVGKTIVSPGHFRYFKGKYWTAPKYGRISSAKTVAVMSGLAVRKTFFKAPGFFDERFRLYGIDTNLMLRYARLHPQLYILDVPFEHNLSQFQKEDAAVAQYRFEDFKRASLLNAELLPKPARWMTRLFLWYRQLRRRS